METNHKEFTMEERALRDKMLMSIGRHLTNYGLPPIQILSAASAATKCAIEYNDESLTVFVDWFGTWQMNKNLSDYGVNDIIDEYKKADNARTRG